MSLQWFAKEETLFRDLSTYNEITVTRKGDIVTLWSPSDVIQSTFNHKKPLRPLLEYIRHLMMSLVFHPNPQSILLLGLGGGVLPRILHHMYPETDIHVVEVDRLMIRTAERFFQFTPNHRVNVIVADAFDFMNHIPRRYDLIIQDAYFGNTLAETVDNGPFCNACAAGLSDGGIAAFNMMTGDAFKLELRLSWLSDGFSNLWLLPGIKKKNMATFAAKHNITKDQLFTNGKVLKNRLPFKLDISGLIKRMQIR